MQLSKQKKKNAYETTKGEKVTYPLICVFVFFAHAKKRK